MQKTVKFLDLKKQHALIADKLKEAVCAVIDSGIFIGGERVNSFERAFARWLGVEQAVGVGCATSGLFAVLKCLGIGVDDEVITTVHTALPTVEAIYLTGAKPVLCDIEEDGYNIDVTQIESKVTQRTKAIIPVHLYGHPVDMDRVMQIAKKYGIFVLEDCAQAQGAIYKGCKVGTIGDAAVFSFFPSKTLGGLGDGGAVVAKDLDLLRKIRMFCNHGREEKYRHEFMGMNSRLDAIQAAALEVMLSQLDEWNVKRREAAKKYNERLSKIKEVKIPLAKEGTIPVYHLYVIMVPDRDGLIKFLKSHGVETGIHYPYSLNIQPALSFLNQGRGAFPRAENACSKVLSLPLYPGISDEDIDYVCEKIEEFFGLVRK